MLPFLKMGSMDWIWQGVLTNGLYALLILAGGIVIARLRARGVRWVDPLLYGCIASVLIFVVIVAVRANQYIGRQSQSIVNDKNIEETIKTWLASSGFGYTEAPAISAPYFSLDVLMLNGSHMMIAHLQQGEKYLIIQTSISVDQKTVQQIHKLSEVQVRRLNRAIAIELARANELFSHIDLPKDNITFEKHLPITATLTQQDLIQALAEVNSAQIIVANTLLNEVGM